MQAEQPAAIAIEGCLCRLGPARLACGEPAEVVASVPVAIRSREPHGGDRAEPDGTRALQARLERGGENQVPAATERQPGEHVRLGMGQRRAEYLPTRSFTVVHPVAGGNQRYTSRPPSVSQLPWVAANRY